MKIKSVIWQIIFFILLSCAFFSTQTFAFQTVSDEKFAQIVQKFQAKLDELHDKLKFPGATAGFVLPDGRFASVASGVADLQTKVPLKPTDKILAGSIGKTFVAAETLLLVQEGNLSLDEKIEKYLGNEKWFDQLPNAKDITLRMLLNHSGGIPNHVEDKSFLKDEFKNAAKDIKYEDLLVYILNKKTLFVAGKGYYYTDTAYILIGLIVEKVTGKTLYDEITRRFLNPLKLSRTIPSNDAALLLAVNGYFQKQPIINKGKFMMNPQSEWAGGGFASTSEDLARWAQALYTDEVLPKNLLDEMLNSTTVGEGKNYGLGVEILRTKFGTAYGHDGEFPGFLSEMRYFPNYKFAVAVQVNSDESRDAAGFIETAPDDFAQIIITELFPDKVSDSEKLKFQKIAEDWLNLIDTGKFEESWEFISDELKAKYTKEKWRDALKPIGDKGGKFKSRKLKTITFPDSQTVFVDFESSFTKFPKGIETVILKLENGKWNVSSYSIK
ncbi:MAG: serine hydrolase [Pyrinomonadaceae bacterium]|nr:serine hydrolase [Pyrinomonadaceae bacterium]